MKILSKSKKKTGCGAKMTSDNPKLISDFNALFNLVCVRHKGPVFVDFGRQKSWGGIIAGECSPNIRFIQAEGFNAFLDKGSSHLVFSEGSGEMLHKILSDSLKKTEDPASRQG